MTICDIQSSLGLHVLREHIATPPTSIAHIGSPGGGESVASACKYHSARLAVSGMSEKGGAAEEEPGTCLAGDACLEDPSPPRHWFVAVTELGLDGDEFEGCESGTFLKLIGSESSRYPKSGQTVLMSTVLTRQTVSRINIGLAAARVLAGPPARAHTSSCSVRMYAYLVPF